MRLIVLKDGQLIYRYTLGGVQLSDSCVDQLATVEARSEALRLLTELVEQGYRIEFNRRRQARPLVADYAIHPNPFFTVPAFTLGQGTRMRA